MKVTRTTTSSQETSAEIDLFEGRKLTARAKKAAAEEVGNYLIEQTLISLSKSQSPVRGEGNFPALSKSYALKKKEEVGHSRPNLEFEGLMYDELDFEVTKNGIRIGVYGERAPAADGHNNFSGKSKLKKRRFLPAEGQNYKANIEAEVERIIADNIASETTFKRSDFVGISTKAQLYKKLADIFGPMSRAELNLSVFRSEDLTDLLSDLGLLGLL